MIRKGYTEDLKRIMDIIKYAVSDMESRGVYQWDSIYPNMDVINNDINNGTLYVFEEFGFIKGIVVLNEHQDKEYEDMKWQFNEGKQLVVHRLCIAPIFQGKGIARLLMDYAEVHGKKLGYDSIRLDAFTQNERACSLYEKLGYKGAGTVHFRKGEFYCYEKKLDRGGRNIY